MTGVLPLCKLEGTPARRTRRLALAVLVLALVVLALVPEACITAALVTHSEAAPTTNSSVQALSGAPQVANTSAVDKVALARAPTVTIPPAASADPVATAPMPDATASAAQTAPITPADGGLFHCGWSSNGLKEALFPDYTINFNERWDKSNRTATADDLLVMGMHGPCKEQPSDFPGKVLFRNGEARGDVRKIRFGKHFQPKRFFQIGALEDTTQSVGAYNGAMLTHRPNFLPGWETITELDHKPINTGQYHAIAYINKHVVTFRENAVAHLSHILPVHYGGAAQGSPGLRLDSNVVPMPHPPPTKSSWWDLTPILSRYKFCFCMENANVPFYVTEKILNAFRAGCIPIYYGTPGVLEIFNPKAFVYYDIKNAEAALEQVQYLASNETAYNQMLHHEPILKDGQETLKQYFSFSESVGGGYLKHKIRSTMGLSLQQS